jgi:hypothetical protein
VVGYLIRNFLKGFVFFKNFCPEFFISSIVKVTVVFFWVRFLKFLQLSSEDFMGKVEENLSQNGEMTMIVEKVRVSMLTTS